MKNIYFIENIIKTQNDNFCLVALFNASLFLENKQLENNSYFAVQQISNSLVRDVNEGSFYFFETSENSFRKANFTSTAKSFIFQNALVRKRLINNITKQLSKSSSVDEEFVSYHVNVGHGNCSFLVEKNTKSIWLVDCSNYDFLNKTYYQTNIDMCINRIKERFSLIDIHLKKVFITHPHFDHYSGIETLINNKYIDSSTNFYLNPYYHFSNPKWNNLLNRIDKLGSMIIEPISPNSSSTIEILYPKNRVIANNRSSYMIPGSIIQPKINNTSIVFAVKSVNNTFLFTGDIETDAWDIVDSCYPYLHNCNYYTISHHGSDNGHIRTKCLSKGISISTVSDCFNRNHRGKSVQPILMGRDKAYSGIYSSNVINDFNKFKKPIVYTETAPHFVEIEWNSNNVCRI
ncbi:MAG: MBL fold metallo-hydrolase [Treponema sp.]|nr:MBL fold metallo-hydrolase [Treponema sp.]